MPHNVKSKPPPTELTNSPNLSRVLPSPSRNQPTQIRPPTQWKLPKDYNELMSQKPLSHSSRSSRQGSTVRFSPATCNTVRNAKALIVVASKSFGRNTYMEEILPGCVLVQIEGRDPRGWKARASPFHTVEDGVTTLSASGIVWSCYDHTKRTFLAIAPASMIFPFLQSDSKSTIRNACQSHLLPGTSISVFYATDNRSNGSELILKAPGTVIGITEVEEFREMLERKMQYGNGEWVAGWALSSVKNAYQSEWLELHTHVASSLAVISFDVTGTSHGISEFCGYKHGELNQGEEVAIIGSPFGCISQHHFLNCLVKGCISNVCLSGHLPKKITLAMLDAKVLPGMEGGAVLNNTSGAFLGMVTQPVHLKNRPTQLEIPLVIPAYQVRMAVDKCLHNRGLGEAGINIVVNENRGFMAVKSGGLQRRAVESVVVIENGTGGWGSGVLVAHNGYILTCSHLFNQDTDLKCKVFVPALPGRVLDATLLYRFKGFLDLAIVKLVHSPVTLPTARLFTGSVNTVLGQAIYAVGYGGSFQSASREGFPMVTKGNVAKVVMHPTIPNRPVMIIGTANIHPGCSGGALCNANGEVVGVITSNTIHSKGTAIPHCSFSVPWNLLREIWEWIQQGQQDDLFEELDEASKRIWSLRSPVRDAVPQKKPERGGKKFRELLENHSKSIFPVDQIQPASRL